VAIADVYDAVISKRVYKDALSHAKAKHIMIEGKGSHFDSVLTDAFAAVEPLLNQCTAINID
jgi:putative two-component system response regulator